MPFTQSFYDILFNEKEVIIPNRTAMPLPEQNWDCRLGILAAVNPKNEAEQKLLNGIMAACGLAEGAWQIFPENTTYQSLRALEHLQFLLLFDYPIKKLNINIQLPFYKPTTFNNHIFINAYSFETIANSPEHKKILWNQALKPLFT